MLDPKTCLLLAAILFSAGVYGVLSRSNLILLLMSLELMLNAVNITLVTFSRYWAGQGQGMLDTHAGQFMALMVMAVAASEVGIGLAIVVSIYRRKHTADASAAAELKH